METQDLSQVSSENILEEFIFSQIVIYEGVLKVGSTNNVEITLEMLKMVKTSHRTYKAAQEEKQKRERGGYKRQAMKRNLELENAIAKKKAVVDYLKDKIIQFDSVIFSLQKQLKK